MALVAVRDSPSQLSDMAYSAPRRAARTESDVERPMPFRPVFVVESIASRAI
jgi:hypothetical protein